MFTRITNTDQLKLEAQRRGSHFFDADALRFFSSRIHRAVYGERYFVTSEQHITYYPEYQCDPRRYTVRRFDVDTQHGRIEIRTEGEFQEYETRHEAHAAARALARAAKSLTPVEVSNAIDAATECLMWCSVVDAGVDGNGEPIIIEASNAHANWSDDALDVIAAEVTAFLHIIEKDDKLPSFGGLTPEQIGHDFILTKNGHGTGFWDRGIGYAGERLTYWAKTFGNDDVYLNDAGELSIQ